MSRGTLASQKRHARPARLAVQEGTRVRIVVADSQAIDRAGMVRLLEDESDLEVIGETATVEDTIQQCRALKPAVLVLSLNLSGQEAEAAIPVIRAQLPTLRVLAMSERGTSNCLVLNPPGRRRSADEPEHPCALGTDCLRLAAAQGAMATIRRDADPEDLFRAIRAVAKGRAWYDPFTVTGLLSSTEVGRSGAQLSDRQLQVAALIAEGKSNQEIATSLGISESTAKKHVGQVLEKLGFADRLRAGLFIARHPLLLKR